MKAVNTLIGSNHGTGQLYNHATLTVTAGGEFQGGLDNFSAGWIDIDGHCGFEGEAP